MSKQEENQISDLEYATSIAEQFPFLSVYKCEEDVIIGFTQYINDGILSIYELTRIEEKAERQKFFNLCKDWYDNSCRRIPISVYFYEEMKNFQYSVVRFNLKQTEFIAGYEHDFNLLLQSGRKKTIKRPV